MQLGRMYFFLVPVLGAIGCSEESGSEKVSNPEAEATVGSAEVTVTLNSGLLIGTSVKLPPASVPEGTVISLSETAAPDTFASVGSALSSALQISALDSKGTPITEATNAYTLSLKTSAETSANLLAAENLCILAISGDKRFFWRGDEIEIVEGLATIQTRYFGDYQARACEAAPEGFLSGAPLAFEGTWLNQTHPGGSEACRSSPLLSSGFDGGRKDVVTISGGKLTRRSEDYFGQEYACAGPVQNRNLFQFDFTIESTESADSGQYFWIKIANTKIENTPLTADAVQYFNSQQIGSFTDWAIDVTKSDSEAESLVESAAALALFQSNDKLILWRGDSKDGVKEVIRGFFDNVVDEDTLDIVMIPASAGQ